MKHAVIDDTDARLQQYVEGELIVTDPPYNIGHKYVGDNDLLPKGHPKSIK